MPEEVVSIITGLQYYCQSEVRTCFCKACVIPLVHAQVKIPETDISFPWILGNTRYHVPVNLPSPIYMLCSIFFGILPNG
ncbi:hypothetical protein Peur_037217 [Populus x canadensis]